MAPIIIIILIAIAIFFVLLYLSKHFPPKFESIKNSITLTFAITAFFISIYSFHESRKTLNQSINPSLQAIPLSLVVHDNIRDINLLIKIINYSDYTAYKIDTDIQFGNKWVLEFQKIEKKAF